MLAPLGEHPFQGYGLFHTWKNGKEQFCNTKGKGEGYMYGEGGIDTFHVIVFMVSSNVRPVSHQCCKSEQSYEAEKFPYTGIWKNGHNVSNISIIHKIQSLDVGFHIS